MSTYERWLIARGNAFAPSASAVAKLVQKLREERWVAAGGTVVTAGGPGAPAPRAPLPAELDAAWLDDEGREELRLVWPADTTLGSTRSPLTGEPGLAAGCTFEIHRASDFVTPVRKEIGELDCTCKCGEDLAYEWDPEEVVPPFEQAAGIFTECEECSRTFDPSKGFAKITNPTDGSVEEVAGGAAYRFALVVTTPAPPTDAKVAFAPELVALLEKEFGRVFYQLATTR